MIAPRISVTDPHLSGMDKPFRFWMTGGVAVVVAALGGRANAANDEQQPLMLTSLSPYSVAETVQRIEAFAQQRGLPVLARVAQPSPDSGDDTRARQVIVLESTQGGTPVLMNTANARPNLPLSVVVQRGLTGATEVLLPEGLLKGLPAEASAAVQHDVARLPGVVAEAVLG